MNVSDRYKFHVAKHHRKKNISRTHIDTNIHNFMQHMRVCKERVIPGTRPNIIHTPKGTLSTLWIPGRTGADVQFNFV